MCNSQGGSTLAHVTTMAPTRAQVIGAVNNIAIQYNFAAMSVAIQIMSDVSISLPPSEQASSSADTCASPTPFNPTFPSELSAPVGGVHRSYDTDYSCISIRMINAVVCSARIFRFSLSLIAILVKILYCFNNPSKIFFMITIHFNISIYI